MDWSQIGKGVHQGCILSPSLFNSYAEDIMWHARLDESQAEITIAERTINNLRYADDTIVMAEIEVKLKSLLIKVKEKREKVDLKLKIQKMKIITFGLIKANWWGKMKTVTDFIFFSSKITVDCDCSHEIKRCLLLGRRTLTNLESILKKQRHHFCWWW